MDQINKIDEVLKRILLENVRQGKQVADIEDETDLINDLALNSILIVNLFVELEEEFHIKIEVADLKRPILNKYRYLKEYVMEKISYGD